MKTKFFPLALFLLMGFVVGVAGQKYIGFGNLLHPATPTPTSLPNVVPPSNLRLFVLAGQSNMVGVAPLPNSQSPLENVYLFGNDYHWHLALDPLDSPVNQVDGVSLDPIVGQGLGLPFAAAVQQANPDQPIGLIPCAKSGVSLSDWQTNLSDQSLFGSCVKRVFAASPMGRPAALLFYQGEGDTTLNTASDASTYAINFQHFAHSFRDAIREPSLPIVFAQIATTTRDFPGWQTIKDQQASVVLECAAMVRTDDQSLADDLHLTAEGYAVVGKRFADAFLVLRDKCP